MADQQPQKQGDSTMAAWGAVIAGGAAVASQMLANKRKIPGQAPGAPSLGGNTQMKPLGSALSGAPNAANPNPAFGQFLQGGLL